jgi:selenoprotein W-related protein
MTGTAPAPTVTITFCTQCNWLLRAGWMAQELLSSFGTDLGAVTLVPGSGAVFRIALDGQVIWDRSVNKGFPDAATLKSLVRDGAFPGRDLGHIDRRTPA